MQYIFSLKYVTLYHPSITIDEKKISISFSSISKFIFIIIESFGSILADLVRLCDVVTQACQLSWWDSADIFILFCQIKVNLGQILERVLGSPTITQSLILHTCYTIIQIRTQQNNGSFRSRQDTLPCCRFMLGTPPFWCVYSFLMLSWVSEPPRGHQTLSLPRRHNGLHC